MFNVAVSCIHIFAIPNHVPPQYNRIMAGSLCCADSERPKPCVFGIIQLDKTIHGRCSVVMHENIRRLNFTHP